MLMIVRWCRLFRSYMSADQSSHKNGNIELTDNGFRKGE
jgi:hypothetical protein